MEYGEKHLQIMEVAEELFAEKGFTGTSVRDIADKAGVNLAMISYYFGSKEKLLEAIFEYRGDSTKLILENIEGKAEISSIEKMNLLIDHYLQKLEKQQCFHRLMVREQSVKSSEVITQMILKLKRQNLEVVKRLVSEGQQKGEFRKDIDVPLLMITMLGTSNQLITSQHHYQHLNNLQDMPENEFQQYLHKKLGQHLKFLFKTILSNEI